MQNKKEAAPVNLDNLLGGLTGEYIQDRLLTIYEQQASLMDMVQLEKLINLHGDFTKRICPKTGTLLAQLDTWQIMRFLEICPHEDFAIEILKRQAIANPAVHWTYTDGNSLDKLMEIDPMGYFVYCAAFVCNNHSPIAHHNLRLREQALAEYENEHGEICHRQLDQEEKSKIRKSAIFDWAWQKYSLRQRIEQYPLAQVVRINEIMRQYLSWFEANEIRKLDTYSALLDNEHTEILPALANDLDSFELYLTSTIKQIVWHEIKNKRLPSDRNIDYMHSLKMKQRYHGYSNFFEQSQRVPSIDENRHAQKREIQLVGFMKIAGVPDGNSAFARIQRELKDKRLIPLNENCTIAKVSTKAVKFSFSKKKDEEITL